MVPMRPLSLAFPPLLQRVTARTPFSSYSAAPSGPPSSQRLIPQIDAPTAAVRAQYTKDSDARCSNIGTAGGRATDFAEARGGGIGDQIRRRRRRSAEERERSPETATGGA
ncbi:hypothetical protein KC325_g41 [Hortaea werneckii]|nr:hypothetical protein KC325_g41 [Hortaea werneckii]